MANIVIISLVRADNILLVIHRISAEKSMWIDIVLLVLSLVEV